MFDKLTLSGYRGKIGAGFDLNKVSELVSAFSNFIGQGSKVALATDDKKSSEMIKYCIISSLLAGGIEIYDLNKVLTSNLQIYIKEKNLNAGIMIGGFKDDAINDIRFFRQDGLQFLANDMQSMLNIYHLKKYNFSKWDSLGKVVTINDVKEIYFKKLAEAFSEVEKIKNKKIKIDGACNIIKEYFKTGAEKYGFSIVKKGEDISFEINTEGSIQEIKIKNKKISTEKILPFVIKLMSDKCKKVITNFSSSFALKEISGIEISETKAGMENIAEKVLNEMADTGGEGCGSVLFPDFVYGYDAFATSIFILCSLTQKTDILKSIPDYFYYKKMINVNPYESYQIINLLYNYLNKKYKVIKTDGLKIIDKNFWITVRQSGSKDVIRIISQAKKKNKVLSLIKDIEKNIKKFME